MEHLFVSEIRFMFGNEKAFYLLLPKLTKYFVICTAAGFRETCGQCTIQEFYNDYIYCQLNLQSKYLARKRIHLRDNLLNYE